MNLKEKFDECIDFIDSKKKTIITVSLSILGFIVLIIIFLVSSDELSVSKESNILAKNIEERKYSIALDNYESWEKEFSKSKMNRFNKLVSKKINKLLLDSGDKYIVGQISKEQYIGLINTVNALENINVDLKKIIEQANRVDEMYQQENVEYDIAISYINTASIINGMANSLDTYKNNIEEINQSRKLYKSALKDQTNKNYYEAITSYNKVLQVDKKYYELANKNKKECIELMYNYYIDKSKEANKNGNYEEALQYIDYIKEYYIDDETILKLEKQYQTNLAMYTLTTDDIQNLIAKKSNKKKENLSVNSFQQMVNDKKYYYTEVYEYDTLIDEVLIDAESKKIYSYKDSNKDYKTNYSDGYFRVVSDGSIQFAISEENAQLILEKKLAEKQNKYKKIISVSNDKIEKYIDNKVDLEEKLKKDGDVYYYKVVNKGLFKKKEVYIINMYTEKLYLIDDDGIKDY
ncbi:UbiD family decarboxylase [Romboutsia ilealis]|uniref:UbiD family decarboxylase n=1 Tax=Romboutsia ilealis TaxID=1115758 RepID=UPI002573BDBC|nr:UbiD family decarboxylase [Romboutsia ilealis]